MGGSSTITGGELAHHHHRNWYLFHRFDLNFGRLVSRELNLNLTLVTPPICCCAAIAVTGSTGH